MQTTETPALTLASENLSVSEYRALREGRVIEPVETPSAADAAKADAEPAAAAEAAENNSEESKQKPKASKGNGLDARFSELTTEIKSLKTQLAAKTGVGPTETKPAAETAPPAPIADLNDPEPDPSKFENYTDWQKQWNRWDRRQETRAAEAARTADAQKQAQAAKASTWQERVKEASSELSDFETVALNKDLPVTQAMADAITESEIGPKLLYHLGSNPDEAARIAKLSPVGQVRAIGKLEAALEAAAAADDEPAEIPPAKKLPVSKAPAPHRPVGGAAAVNSAKNIDSMPLSEYRALRDAGKIR